MRAIRNEEAAKYILTPTDDAEREAVKLITASVKVGDRLEYEDAGETKDGRRIVTLYIGGHEEEVVDDQSSGITFHSTRMVNGHRFEVIGTSEEDDEVVQRLRFMCRMGGGPIYLGTEDVNDVTSLLITGGHKCKHCDKHMIKTVEVEWNVCDECAAKCKHEYERGIVHGGGIDAGVGHFCGKCGRGKPKTEEEKKMTQLDHHRALENELGIKVLYK